MILTYNISLNNNSHSIDEEAETQRNNLYIFPCIQVFDWRFWHDSPHSIFWSSIIRPSVAPRKFSQHKLLHYCNTLVLQATALPLTSMLLCFSTNSPLILPKSREWLVSSTPLTPPPVPHFTGIFPTHCPSRFTLLLNISSSYKLFLNFNSFYLFVEWLFPKQTSALWRKAESTTKESYTKHY